MNIIGLISTATAFLFFLFSFFIVAHCQLHVVVFLGIFFGRGVCWCFLVFWRWWLWDCLGGLWFWWLVGLYLFLFGHIDGRLLLLLKHHFWYLFTNSAGSIIRITRVSEISSDQGVRPFHNRLPDVTFTKGYVWSFWSHIHLVDFYVMTRMYFKWVRRILI